MTVYVPNVGEKEALKDVLHTQGIILGLYKNLVVPGNDTTIDTLEEMPTGGGRGYAQKELTNDLIETATPTADMWAISYNSSGKAQAQYDDAALEWAFLAADVADVNTVYGIFGYSWVLPFDAGAYELKVGDTIKGATSGATGIVTGVEVNTGTWAAGTAAGYLKIMTKTGTWVDGENILVSGEVATIAAAPTAGGTGYAEGDLVEISTGGSGALVVVTEQAAGIVSAVALASGGAGYTIGAGKATTAITGAGNDDLTVEIATLAAVAYAVTNTGVTGDAHKKLRFTEAFSAGKLVDTVGQKITYVPILTMSTG